MNHLCKATPEGFRCFVCGENVPYEVPDICWQKDCGKPFTKSVFVLSPNARGGAAFEVECENGHKGTWYPGGAYEECPKTKVIGDLLSRWERAPQNWEVTQEGGWEKFGESVAELLRLALKVDALFPDGLLSLALKVRLAQEAEGQ